MAFIALAFIALLFAYFSPSHHIPESVSQFRFSCIHITLPSDISQVSHPCIRFDIHHSCIRTLHPLSAAPAAFTKGNWPYNWGSYVSLRYLALCTNPSVLCCSDAWIWICVAPWWVTPELFIWIYVPFAVCLTGVQRFNNITNFLSCFAWPLHDDFTILTHRMIRWVAFDHWQRWINSDQNIWLNYSIIQQWDKKE